MHISSYPREDDMDWEEYVAEMSNSRKLLDLLCADHYGYCLELINTMHPLHAFN